MEKRLFRYIVGILSFISIILFIALLSGLLSKDDHFLPDHLDSSSCPKDFSPLPVILVSFDGFRADYLERGVTPTLNEMKKKGSSTPFMAPSFPSSTFPNHYTIVTGLYPESHGIVSNVFYDRKNNATYSQKTDSMKDGRWYRGQPMWITVKKNNLSSATYFWPGSEAPIEAEYPTYWKTYSRSSSFAERIDTVLEWLDLPYPRRPSWISIYYHQPDRNGHVFGPDSDEVTKAVGETDKMIRYLLERLKERNLLSCVNIIVVSDHGMASTNYDEVIPLEKLISKDLWDKVVLNYSRITFKKQYDEEERKELETALSCKMKEFQIFRREELPKRLHYSGNELNGDYVFLLEEGYVVTLNSNYTMKGNHGYDSHKTTMHGLFLAYGPAFKMNFEVKPFQNTELYNLMCYLLNIPPAPNNGTEGLLSTVLKTPPLIPSFTKSKPWKTQLINETQWKQNYNESDCHKNDATLQLLMKVLNMSDELMSRIEKKVAPWWFPMQKESRVNITLLFHPDHVTGYASGLKLPLWTSFTVERAPSTRLDATPQWLSDIRLKKENSPSCRTSYRNLQNGLNLTKMPLFQPEFSLNETTTPLSFLISEATPFSAQLIPRWNNLTLGLIPEWLKTSNSPLNIVVGPVFDRDADELMDEDLPSSDNVAIPTDYFAIVTRCSTKTENLEDCPEDDVDSLAFVYPQKLSFKLCLMNEENFALLFSAKIRDVERLTGLIFFPGLRPKERLELITKEYYQLW